MHGHPKTDAPRTMLDLLRFPIVLAVATVALGTTGLMLADHGAASPRSLGELVDDLLSSLYHSLQFLFLHGAHLDPPVHPLVHVARFTGAASLGWTGLAGLLELLRRATRRGHVVICGLGDLGVRLALEARDRGLVVVAIDKAFREDRVATAKANGVAIVQGDAMDPKILRRARVDRADTLVAVCGDDTTNQAIVLGAALMVSSSRTRATPLLCRLLIRDPAKRKPFLELAAAASPDRSRVRILSDEVDPEDAAARQALRDHPLDFRPILPASPTTVHLVVVGFGPVARALALQAARLAHFGNAADADRRLRLTLVGEDAAAATSALRAGNGAIDAVCDLEGRTTDGTPDALRRVLGEISAAADARAELVTIAFCHEGAHGTADRLNRDLAGEAAPGAEERPVQFLVYQSRKPEAGASLRPATKALSPRMHAFGMVEGIFAWDVLVRESDDAVARALHEEYGAGRAREVPPAEEPSWAALTSGLKDSNRQAADHIPIKLRALGYHAAPAREGRPDLGSFTKDETELLAKLEHRRWCAERRLAGWNYGQERDRERRLHPSLVPWDRLEEGEREKDREQVRAIQRALAGAGLGIYR